MPNLRSAARFGLFGLLSVVGCNIPTAADFEPKPEPDVATLPPPVTTPPVVGFQVVEVIPDFGAPKGFDLIELHGGGFRKDSRVFFGGSESPSVTVASENVIYALTPPHSVGLVTVSVVNIDGTAASITPGFGYTAGVEVTAVVPDHAPASGGSPVEVRGHGFTGAAGILFGGRLGIDLRVLDDETALVTLPEHAAGIVNVHVVTPFGTGEARRLFRYTSRPVVDALSPLVSPPSGGGTLTIVGQGLSADAAVRIGGTLAEPRATSTDGTRLVVLIPAGPVGPADVSVASADGVVVLERAFHWAEDSATAALLGVFPSAGPSTGGGEVSVVLPGVTAPADALQVFFGDAPADVLSFDAARHLAVVVPPAGTAGTTVAVSAAASGTPIAAESGAPVDYTYVAALGVVAISPASGPAIGGTPITITGVGFSGSSAITVTIGGLPATNVAIDAGDVLTAVTPLGSPGSADVVVWADGRDARLSRGFQFIGDGPNVLVIDPPRGAIAGNTWVRLYGTDLPDGATVTFDGMPAPFVQRRSSTELVVRTPRAQDVALVDVGITAPGFTQRLTEAFSYFDPASGYGGTWGDRIDGSLNVTVLAAGSGDPVEAAMVVVGHELPPRLLGYTDDRGQVTLSDGDLTGRLDVTAAKYGSSAGSVIDFDAENVTLLVSVPAPPSTGTPPPQLLPGTVTGTVEGVGKYLTLPPWPCTELSGRRLGFCDSCDTDADCGLDAPRCTRVSGARPFCSATCQTDADCLRASDGLSFDPDFVCRATDGGDVPRCVPNPGRARAECALSDMSYLLTPTTPFGDAVVDLDAGDRTFQLDGVRLGEVAIYCVAGGYREGQPSPFKPMVMGIARHQMVMPGSDPTSPIQTPPTDASLVLDIPLDRATTVLFGEQPEAAVGTAQTTLQAHINLGSDGYVPIATTVVPPEATSARITRLPRLEDDSLTGSEYVFRGVWLVTDTSMGLPESDVLRLKVRTLERGAALRGDGAGWNPWITGYDGDVLALVTTSDGQAFGATAAGAIIHFDGASWGAQPITHGPALRAATSDLIGGAVFVGDEGRVVRWRDGGWETSSAGTPAALRGVTAIGPDALVAVGDYTIRVSSADTWSEADFGPPKVLNGVQSAGGHTVAVGRFGAVVERAADGSWAAIDVPQLDDLNAVYVAPDGFVAAVGAGGRGLIRPAGGAFASFPVGTDAALYAIDGRSSSDLYAVGDRATVVHFDGHAWSHVTERLADVSLRAVAASHPDELMALGVPGVAAGPFLFVPSFTAPTSGGPWTNYHFAWGQKARSPSLYNLRIYGSQGSIWSVMAPGWRRTITLPDLNAISGQPLVPTGPKSMLVTTADSPTFDIDAYDNSALSPDLWRAWVYQLHDFDSGIDRGGALDAVP